ncbi:MULTISPECIES: hypothetical protein [unclassified Streptomyces]|uniref:hypothetical protein n=1 Tax=unclassified Streptomyces TaxID=2593676 RepID=UPI0037F36ABB
MTPPTAQPSLALVLDCEDDAAFTHTALAAHAPQAGRITLHPGPGTTGDTDLAHDLLLALGKPAHIPGRFPHGRPPLWEAAAAWTTALAVTRLTVLRAHLLNERRLHRILDLWRQTGIHITLVVHRPRLTAALDRALAATGHTTVRTLTEAHALYRGGDTPGDTPPRRLPRRRPPGGGSPSNPWTAWSPTTAPGPAPLPAPRSRSSISSAQLPCRRRPPSPPCWPTVCTPRQLTRPAPRPSRQP